MPVPMHPLAQMCWHPDMLVSSFASPHPPRCAQMCSRPGPAAPLSPPTLGDGLSCAGAFIHRDADSVCPTPCPLPPWYPCRLDPAPQNWGGSPLGRDHPETWRVWQLLLLTAHSPKQCLAPVGMWGPPNVGQVGQLVAADEVHREKHCWEDEEGAGGRCRGDGGRGNASS